MENYTFKISSALKSIIGKDLITDDFVAIFELVKNSFDAFATNVEIYFLFSEESKIYIVDNGKGMNKEDLIEKWLFVAYSAKKDGTEDKNRKEYAGNKGVGRFSCDRLGSKLVLQTKVKNSHSVHTLNINWDLFEKNSQNLFNAVQVQYKEAEKYDVPKEIHHSSSGVILEISCLREEDSWTRDKLLRLKRSLEKLIDPIETKKGREIKLICPREELRDEKEVFISEQKETEPILVNGKIENKIFDVLKDKTTTIYLEVNDKGIMKTELYDRGTFIYSTQENISSSYPALVGTDLSAQISFLNKSAKSTFKRRMKIDVVQYGSIFLIKNGFRVYPIGEKGFDFWDLDHRHQQGYARYLSSRNTLGIINIYGDESKFKESSSRDKGLIETEASIQLKDIVIDFVKKLESYVVDIIWKDKLDVNVSDFRRMSLDENRAKIISLIESLSNSRKVNVIGYNKEIISILDEKSKQFSNSLTSLKIIAENLSDPKLLNEIKAAETKLQKAKREQLQAEKIADQERQNRIKAEKLASQEKQKRVIAVEKQREAERAKELAIEREQKVSSYYEEEKKRNIFLTGSASRDKDLLEGFIHQIILYASNSKAMIQNKLKPNKVQEVSVEQYKDTLSELLDNFEKIISTSRFATTANFRLTSSTITENLNKFIEEYLKKIAPAYNARIQINFFSEVEQFNLTFNPIEFGMVIENFISNAKKARASEITFHSFMKNKIYHLEIHDNGNGLAKNIEHPSLIFEKGFTRTKGSGLGLYHSKRIIQDLGGEIELAESQDQKGITFIVRMAQK